MGEHVGGSRSHDTHLGFKRVAGVGTRECYPVETQRRRAECVSESLTAQWPVSPRIEQELSPSVERVTVVV